MLDRSTVKMLAQAVEQFEALRLPARNLAAWTRREYSRDLRYFLSSLEQREDYHGIVLTTLTGRHAALRVHS